MNTRRSQQGLSSIGWLLVILVAGFFLTCAFKLVPAYADNMYIKDGLKSLSEFENTDRGYAGMSNSDIRSHLSNYFYINNVRSEATKSIDIERKRDKVLVNINYETRVPLFYNIEVVMTFNNQFDSNRPAACCKPQSE
ncbi:MAG: DUF4845 domain-containing protein [Cellvibrionaceae bacterium]